MKLNVMTLALAALATNAHAAGDGLNPTGSFDLVYRLAGASAVDNLIFDNVLKNICASNVSVLNKPTIPASGPHTLGNYFGVACKAKTTAQEPLIDPAIAGRNVLFLKRAAGGSAFGVNTLLENPPRPIAQINPASCTPDGTYATAAGIGLGEVDAYRCSNTADGSHVAQDGGIADVNPELFVRDNTPAGFTDVNLAELATKFGTVRGAYGNVFGIAVSRNLRDALQAAQFDPGQGCTTAGKRETEECMPSLPRQLVASLMRGGAVTDWNQVTLASGPNAGKKLVEVVTAPGTTLVKICRRTPGSGTQATINNVIMGAPHSTGGIVPAQGNNPNIAQGSGAGDVARCLQAWNTGTPQTIATDKTPGSFCVNGTGDATTGACLNPNPGTPVTGWALGPMGLERANANFRFVKLDGVAPTAKNAHAGTYTMWSEGVFTQRVDSFAPPAEKQAFLNTLRAFTTRAAEVKALNDLLVASGAAPAYVALGTVSGNRVDATWDPNNPTVGFTHGATATNNAAVPTMNPTHRATTPLGF
jgi:ABC-type phosphate transport system substrate-binding protein